MSHPEPLTCHLCGLDHQSVELKPGQKAACSRCDTVLAVGSRFGPDAPLCFAVTGLIFAVPAVVLPVMSAEKLGDERVSWLLTGVDALWGGRMRALSVVVLLTGAVLPVVLLASLALLHAPARFGFGRQRAGREGLARLVEFLGHWAIPEVQVLALLVAMVKLGDSLAMTIGPGFWCYAGMGLALLLARYSFALAAPARKPASRIPAS
jgi:paraquat-inducible protein A